MQYAYVLDCSVTMSWLFHDEQTAKVLKLRELMKTKSVLVPGIWSLEVANVLWAAEKKMRITAFQSSQYQQLLNELPIETDENTAEYALQRILELAREYDITVYDASYLELSLRFTCPLATMDKALQAVAVKAGIPLLPE